MNLRTKALLSGTLAVSLSCSLMGAIGDNAPPVPATFKTAHPRLSFPDAGYLNALAANSTALAAYNATANSWDSTNPQGSWQLRRLVIAYLANKIANPSLASTYLAKITALADLGGSWGPLLAKVNDGVGVGTYSLSSASANFLTACGGSSCVGNVVSVNARAFNIVAVPDAHTLTLGQSNPPPNGTNLPIRIFSYLNESDMNIALVYDWLYNDLDPATRTAFMNQLDVLCTEWEENYVGIGASPYNDQFYIELGTFGLFGGLVIYQDHPNGAKHLNFMSDVWFNTLLPVWKQVFGPEGGGWHESYQDYVIGANGNGLNTFITPSLLAWQTATGDPILTRESWVKNYAYFTMYTARPDFILENIGDTSRDTLVPESPALSSLSGLAEYYNDPVIRAWARIVNAVQPMAALDGFEPSTWPFYRPDNKSNPVSTRAALPTTRNFPGWGMLFMRTGWGENDTSATLKYGDNFWSHEHFDTGSFTIFSRGLLALDSGSYRSGSLSEHENQYARQTIAHNTLTVTDPADVYSTAFETFDNQGNVLNLVPPNDGGQRRIGTLYNSHFPQLASPNNMGQWLQNWDYYHTGTMVAYSSTPHYTYTAVDITAAYNNRFSPTTPNATNRTYRVQKAVRHMIFIPRGSSAYVVVYDQVNSTNASFVKRWILHSVNQPVINGNQFQITRNELVSSLPFPGLWPQPFITTGVLKNTVGPANNAKYQYDGKLYGWMVQPGGATITAIGGAGKEFWVEDPLHPGTGTNWNQCMKGQCAANVEGLGATDDIISPNPLTAPHEPGSWRIEEKPGSPALQDYFLNVMLATTAEDVSIPTNVTVPGGLPAGSVGATWIEGGKTYTISLPQSGVGGHITISGVIDEDLLAHAVQLPASMKVASGTPQSGTVGSSVQPLVVTVLDSGGNPVPNATVHYAISQGNGYLSDDTATTGTNGQASVTLTLGSGTTGSVTTVLADVNGLQPVEFDITIGGSPIIPTLSTLSCVPASVVSGGSSTCTVSLTSAAPVTGLPVVLLSSSPDVQVPLTVIVPANSSAVNFTATAGTGTTGEQVTISATLLTVTKTATLTFAPIVLSSITCTPSGVNAGSSANCTVTLSQFAVSPGATVTLSTSSPAITIPQSVLVPAAASSANFTASVKAGSSSQVVSIGATFGGVTFSASITIVVPGSGTPIPVNTWTTVPTNGFPPAVVGYDNLIYAPGVKKFLMWENYHNLTSESNEAMLAYDFSLNRWDVWGLNGNFHSESLPESGHEVGMLQYDPNRNLVIDYCCHSGSQGYDRPEHTWIFDPVGRVGRDVQPPSMPGLASEAQAAFDAADGVYVLYERGAGTWIYDPGKNSWTQMNPNGTPPTTSGYFGAMAYNSTDHKMYLFGGNTGSSSFTNDLYTYDVPSNTWTKLTPSGTLPSPRQFAGFAYDSKDNIFLMFGGANPTILLDTWVYNPVSNAWSQLTPLASPPASAQPVYERLAYDADDNVFVMVWTGPGGYANGPAQGYSNAQTWFYRYSAGGNNVGGSNASFSPSSGSINRNSDAWANEPAIASDGSNLVAGWIETGRPFDGGNLYLPHVYANQLSGSNWSALGSSYLALDSEFNGFDEAHAPSTAVIAGTPWISWYKTNNSGTLLPNSLYAKSWNGTSWVGGAVGGVDTSANFIIQNRSQLAGVGSTPYIAFLENDRKCYPWCQYLYVKSFNGTAWTLVGSGALNRNAFSATASPLAESVSMTSDGSHPFVAWTEDTQASTFKSETAPQVYVSTWNGSAWNALGNSLNVNPANWAYDASIAYFGGSIYVAWTERSQTGSAQLFVKSWNGSSWNLVGTGSLNTNQSTGWAFRPSLVAADKLYIAWAEQPALGQPAQAFVAMLNNGAWTQLASSLNMDPLAGSVERVSLAVLNGQPVAAWGEVKDGSLRQIFVKQWNGSTWVTLSGTATAPPTAPAPLPVVTINSPVTKSTVSTTITLSATATSSLNIASVQFQLDGTNLGQPVTGAGPNFSTSWNTTGATNGSHTITAIATDSAGNHSSTSITVTVNNISSGPAVSGVVVSGITTSGANISWTTDKSSTSQVVYGATPSYGATSSVSSSMVTAHSVALAGLSASTLYHYQVQSRDSGGNLGTSTDFTFTTSGTTPSSPQTVGLLIHGDATEVSGIKAGATVTPASGPAGFTGSVVVNGQGSVNFAPAASGNGVYFTNCCSNTDNAYYKFTSASIGNIFNTSHGQLSFYLKSRYSFAQRQTAAAAPRYTFDVRDGNGNHLFGFLTQVNSGSLQFTYTIGGVSQFYVVPAGTEDTLFGNGVVLNVNLAWSSTGMTLSLNGKAVKTSAYSPAAANWTAASVFDLGAYEFSTAGGFRSSDDIIDEFSVNGSAGSAANKCDLNGDGVVNALDVTSAVNQALGVSPCTNADLRQNGKCDAVDVQRVVNASLGAACVIGQ